MIYLGIQEKERANKMLWALLTIITIIVMAFIYLIIYIRESNYLFPIPKAEYTNIKNMIEEKSKTKLPQKSNIIFIYDRFGIPNNDDIFIFIKIPEYSEHSYVNHIIGIRQKSTLSIGKNSIVKIHYISTDSDKLTSYMREHGKEQIVIITPVYIIISLLVLFIYFKAHRFINRKIISMKKGECD